MLKAHAFCSVIFVFVNLRTKKRFCELFRVECSCEEVKRTVSIGATVRVVVQSCPRPRGSEK